MTGCPKLAATIFSSPAQATTSARSFALCASTPWNLMRRTLGQATNMASRCMSSSGLMIRCMVPSRHGVFSFSSTCSDALICMRPSGGDGRVM